MSELPLMREERDCHVPAIAIACEVTYEEAAWATSHRDLPGPLESPIFSNPWNLYRALIKLGFWKYNVNWNDLKNGRPVPMRTMVLIKDSQLEQHWIIWGGIDSDGRHLCYWGDSQTPRRLTEFEMRKMFLESWPNCAFQVYKTNIVELIYRRIELFYEKYIKGVFSV